MPIAIGIGSSPVFGIALAGGPGGAELCLLLQDGTNLLLQDEGCLLLNAITLTLLAGGTLDLLNGGVLDLIT